jgi:NAD(P)H-dependent FMN reductase
MKILAFAGSNSSTSINKELLKTVLQNFNNEDIKLIDLLN